MFFHALILLALVYNIRTSASHTSLCKTMVHSLLHPARVFLFLSLFHGSPVAFFSSMYHTYRFTELNVVHAQLSVALDTHLRIICIHPQIILVFVECLLCYRIPLRRRITRTADIFFRFLF